MLQKEQKLHNYSTSWYIQIIIRNECQKKVHQVTVEVLRTYKVNCNLSFRFCISHNPHTGCDVGVAETSCDLSLCQEEFCLNQPEVGCWTRGCGGKCIPVWYDVTSGGPVRCIGMYYNITIILLFFI